MNPKLPLTVEQQTVLAELIDQRIDDYEDSKADWDFEDKRRYETLFAIRNALWPTKPLSIRELKAAIRALGLTCRFLSTTGEFRINYTGGKEATAYYTEDRDDALATAQQMANTDH